jgi:hypothetical protein
MRTIVTNLKWRWVIITILISFGSLFLLKASSPPSEKNAPARAGASKSDSIERQAIHNVAAAFTFSAPVEMVRPRSPIFFQQGGEPEIKVDNFGNIYVTAIQGVPGGVDLWKSNNNGTSFVFLGQPDGAQDHCPTIPQCAGLGGGDDQIDVLPAASSTSRVSGSAM